MSILFIFLIQANPVIQEMVNKVSSDSIISNIQRLQDFKDRNSQHDSCFAAAEWIYNKFIAYNMDSTYHESIDWPPPVPPNIIGIKKGTLYPDSSYLVVCAHYDAINENTPESLLAPGADDNASGVASVLEAARIMKDYQFEENIRFIAISAEEGMMLGSGFYTYWADMRGDNIKSVFNVDMIGYVDMEPESLEVFGDTFCEPLVDHFIACSDTYTTILTRKRTGTVGDGGNFSHYGWLTASLIEDDYPNNNPYRHSPADTIGAGFNNLPFCTNSIKSIIAALASSSRPYGISESKNIRINDDRLIIFNNPIQNHGFIKYSVVNNGRLSIKLYNIAGQLLKIINNEYKYVGNYQTCLDCRDLSQGAYILVMETNNKRISRSFSVIR